MATYHVFKEITPDSYTYTRISSLLDTGKSVQDLLAQCVYLPSLISDSLFIKLSLKLQSRSETPRYLWIDSFGSSPVSDSITSRSSLYSVRISAHSLDDRLDESTKSAAYIWEILSDPATVKSNEPSESAFSKYVGRGRTTWEYYADPEQAFRNSRFNMSMHGIQRLQPPEIMLTGMILFYSSTFSNLILEMCSL